MKGAVKHKAFILAAILWALLTGLQAKHSDEFILGNYSYIKNSFPFFYENRETLCREMQELGYNSSIIETDEQDPDFEGLLGVMDKYGLDAWITDRGWFDDPAVPARFALTPLSTSSYQRFEAEYSSEKAVNKGDNKDHRFWYAFRNDDRIKRSGKATAVKTASNGYVWKLRRGKNKAGYALSDLRYRWPNVNGDYIRFGKEFHLYQKNPRNFKDDYFWVTYRIKVSNPTPDLKPSDVLFKLQIAGFELSGGGFAKEAKLISQKQGENTWQETNYTYKDYQTQKTDGDQYFNLEIKLAYTDLIAANLLTADLDDNPSTWPSAYLMKISNLNPRLYWQGNCDLEVDYVELEDQIHHELVSDPNFWAYGLMKRLGTHYIKGKGNVSGFYTFDEPYQGQFDSYRILEKMAAEGGYKMFTATYDYLYDKVVAEKKGPRFYDHLSGFRKIVQPQILANDIYPIKPDIEYNPSKSKSEKAHFIQEVLDRKLLPVYQAGKEYCLEDASRKFYPIVQVFGSWAKAGDKGQWSAWSRPPRATQKSLLYLPLCYGADGIFHYRFQSFNTPEGYGDYAALSSLQDGKNYLSPVRVAQTWNVLEQSNPRVKLYGTMIRNLSWKGAATVMLSELPNKDLKKAALLKSVKVKKARNGSYEGYIQLGVYQDEDKNPYLMVVNRRGNYFKPDKYPQAKLVPPSEYEACFPEADPQTLLVVPSGAALKRFGADFALVDPASKKAYFSKDGVFELVLPAGEGSLLQFMKKSEAKALSGKGN